MNLYEMNKIGYASLPTMTEKELEKSCELIRNFLTSNPSKYYLMLNNEARYYTIYTFRPNYANFSEMAQTIIEIAAGLGEIKSIELTNDESAVEFWIVYEGECKVFYLFDYSKGVVEI